MISFRFLSKDRRIHGFPWLPSDSRESKESRILVGIPKQNFVDSDSWILGFFFWGGGGIQDSLWIPRNLKNPGFLPNQILNILILGFVGRNHILILGLLIPWTNYVLCFSKNSNFVFSWKDDMCGFVSVVRFSLGCLWTKFKDNNLKFESQKLLFN